MEVKMKSESRMRIVIFRFLMDRGIFFLMRMFFFTPVLFFCFELFFFMLLIVGMEAEMESELRLRISNFFSNFFTGVALAEDSLKLKPFFFLQCYLSAIR